MGIHKPALVVVLSLVAVATVFGAAVSFRAEPAGVTVPWRSGETRNAEAHIPPIAPPATEADAFSFVSSHLQGRALLDPAVGQGLRMASDASAWVDSVRSQTAGPQGPLPVESSLESVRDLLGMGDAAAQALIDAVGVEAATAIAYLRNEQLAAESPSELAPVVDQVAQILRVLSFEPAVEDNLTEDRCPTVPDNAIPGDEDVDGEYGVKGGVCILGTRSGAYSSMAEHSFGSSGGILVDLGGDDSYASAGFLAFGSSNGLFIDVGGNDDYQSSAMDSFGTSMGLFLDVGGDDVYHAASDAAFGTGIGVFLDLAGADSYTQTAEGLGRAAFADDAVFLDGGGSDRYTATAGRAFGSSFGQFIDRDGDDTYEGAGSSFGVDGGHFHDLAGDDTYIGLGAFSFGATNHGPSQGATPGVFLDVTGDDRYTAGEMAFGFHGEFVDAGGEDEYSARRNAFGSGQLGAFSGKSSFIDLGGDDVYQSGSQSFGSHDASKVEDAVDDWDEKQVFVDVSGNDEYTAGFNSLGSGAVRDCMALVVCANAAAFLDLGGDDVYVADADSFGCCLGAFADVGGADAYPLGGGPFGPNGTYDSEVQDLEVTVPGLFIDSEAPAGTAFPNGQVVQGGRNASLPAIPSPFTVLLQTAGQQSSFNIQLLPEVVRFGAPSAFTATINTRVPVLVVMKDDDRRRLTLTPSGTGGLVPGIFATAGQDVTVAATYDPLTPGDHNIVITARDPASMQILDKVVRGPVTVDGAEPFLGFDFSDGSPDEPDASDALLWHSESSTTSGIRVEAGDSQGGLAFLYASVDEPIDVETAEPVFTAPIGPDGRGPTGIIPHNIPLSTLAQGNHTIYAVAIDAVGFVTERSLEVRLDRTAPTATVSYSNGTVGSAGWFTRAPNVNVKVGDGLAGVESIHWNWWGATIFQDRVAVATPGGVETVQNVVPREGLRDGVNRLNFTVYDLAHAPNRHISAGLQVLKLDTQPPKSLPNLPAGSLRSPLLLRFNVTDPTSGVDKTFVKAWRSGETEPAVYSAVSVVNLSRPGSWNVRYYSIDKAGNSETPKTLSLSLVTSPPAAFFRNTPTLATTATSITFEDLSSDADGNIVSRTWDFGDGSTATDATVSHRFLENGLYPVRLTVRDNDGAATVFQKNLTIGNQRPAAAWSFLPLSPSRFDEIQFTDASSDADGSIVGYQWDFGDGSASAARNPRHLFDTAGVYQILLTVTDNDGDRTNLYKNVTVTFGRAPLADFDYSPASPTTLTSVLFTDRSVERDTEITTWSWDYGDGGRSLGPSASHRYHTPGNYRVVLATYDEFGAFTTHEETLTIRGIPPSAAIDAPTVSAVTGTALTFRAVASDPDGTVRTYQWRYGDGATDTGDVVAHTFRSSGAYLVNLTVTDDDGLQAFHQVRVTISNRAPLAQFTYSPDIGILTGDLVQFVDASTDPDGTIASRRWTLSPTATSTLRTPGHTYNRPGVYKVTLQITDDSGATASMSRNVTVANRAPTASFAPSLASVLTGEAVKFMDNSTDPDGTIAARAWTFGDGAKSNETSPSHAYSKVGTYKVRLTVKDDSGADSSSEQEVSVRNRGPNASIAYKPALPTTSTPVEFTDKSLDPDGTIKERTWDFGDGAKSTLEVATHQYAKPGKYKVNLTVVDSNGALAYRTIQIEVVQGAAPVNPVDPTPPTNLPPVAAIGVMTANATTGSPVRFADASTDSDGSIAGRSWSFGDGAAGEGTPVDHVFDAPGSYQIDLLVTDDDGATSTARITLVVSEAAQPLSTDEVPSSSDTPFPGLPWLLLVGLLGLLLAPRRR